MTWRISFTKNASKFLETNQIPKEKVFELVTKAIRKLQGGDINIDIKKLKGEWVGFYRIRMGKIRIIAEFDFDNSAVFIEEIDWRGNVY